MSVIRWAPFEGLDLLERRMRRMFDDFGFAPISLPAADVYETDDEFVVELEVPGFEEKELEVQVSDHLLTVKGERTEIRDEADKTFRMHERLAREFERSFALPLDADTEHVTATFGKGVLKLHSPKLARSTPRKIGIAAS